MPPWCDDNRSTPRWVGHPAWCWILVHTCCWVQWSRYGRPPWGRVGSRWWAAPRGRAAESGVFARTDRSGRKPEWWGQEAETSRWSKLPDWQVWDHTYHSPTDLTMINIRWFTLSSEMLPEALKETIWLWVLAVSMTANFTDIYLKSAYQEFNRIEKLDQRNSISWFCIRMVLKWFVRDLIESEPNTKSVTLIDLGMKNI